ncbi:MAG: SusD/RagB family nutrient-binding outer membrane lipoprotein [Bacteroidetes bacterium]|nr:SusD/RagB family nutrient-binding outer membrane lipoprotein [Bacteroidota bacterium]
MKKYILAITAIAITTTVFFSSCTKKIDEAYANPNANVRVPVEQLLPPIISTMAANSAGHGVLNDIRFVGKYVQNFLMAGSGGQYDQMGGTIGASDNAASIWRTHFYDIGQNCVKMIEWAQEEKKWNYAGVGKAIQAWSWLCLSDYHGEVIDVNEAFNPSKLTFTYGTQESVYNHVRQLCYDAINYLNNTGDASTQANLALGDAYFYNGDVNKWKKFVYGVLARSYHHLTNKATYRADSVIFYCDKAITANSDNGTVKFAATGISGNSNFFGPLRGNLGSVAIGTETAIRQSAYIANLMSGLNNAFPGVTDPRAIYLLRTNANGTFRGLTPSAGQNALAINDRPESFWGVPQNVTTPNNTAPGNDNNCRYVFRNSSEFPIMTASEILFIKAEALFRSGNKPGALAAYQTGIDLNFDMLTTTFGANVPAANVITPAIKSGFLTNTTVVPASPASLTLTQIMLQKYIALYIHGILETWVDMRRYHYTDLDENTGQQVYRDFQLPATLFANNNGKAVYRVRPRYNSEYVWNLNELNRIGAGALDYHTKRCWFSEP